MGDGPDVPTALEAVEVASADHGDPLVRGICARVGVVGEKVAFDRCAIAVKFDQDVGDVVLARHILLIEGFDDVGGKAGAVSLPGAVRVGCPVVVHAADQCLVATVDATAVPVQHLFDLEVCGDVGDVHGSLLGFVAVRERQPDRPGSEWATVP